MLLPESPEARAVARALFKYVLGSDVPGGSLVRWIDMRRGEVRK